MGGERAKLVRFFTVVLVVVVVVVNVTGVVGDSGLVKLMRDRRGLMKLVFE